MSSFWSDACNKAQSRPLQAQLDNLYACSGVTIAGFCACAVYSGVLLWRWRQCDKAAQRQMWRLYGAFTALIFFGSCVGAAAWAARMQEFAFFYPVSKVPATGFTPDEVQLYYARAYLWSAAFLLLYAVEFFCLSAAKLMVLDRVQDFAAVGSDGSISGRSKLGRVVMGIVVVGNFVGLGCNIASASFFKQTADLRLRAAAAYSSNSSAAASDLIALSKQKSQIGDATASVQYFSEVAVLIVIIIAFAVVGVTSARLIRSALRRLQLAASQSSFAARGAESSNQVFQLATAAGAEGRQLQRKILGTFTFVFVTFLLRAVFSTMLALARALQNEGDTACGFGSCDSQCHNVYTLMFLWILYTPEFQMLVVFVASPLSLLVALWGMTDVRALELMAANRERIGTMRETMLRGQA